MHAQQSCGVAVEAWKWYDVWATAGSLWQQSQNIFSLSLPPPPLSLYISLSIFFFHFSRERVRASVAIKLFSAIICLLLPVCWFTRRVSTGGSEHWQWGCTTPLHAHWCIFDAFVMYIANTLPTAYTHIHVYKYTKKMLHGERWWIGDRCREGSFYPFTSCSFSENEQQVVLSPTAWAICDWCRRYCCHCYCCWMLAMMACGAAFKRIQFDCVEYFVCVRAYICALW